MRCLKWMRILLSWGAKLRGVGSARLLLRAPPVWVRGQEKARLEAAKNVSLYPSMCTLSQYPQLLPLELVPHSH